VTIETMTDRVPCDVSPECLHRACKDCGEPMRSSSIPVTEHPGTRPHKRGGSCGKCSWSEVTLLPSDLQDQRDVLLSDEEMLHIMTHHPEAFTWHAERRKRLRLGEYS